MPLQLLSGDDVFISYSRRDGALYAAGLADKLTEKGLSCFIDKLGTEPNHDLPDSLKKKIRGCTVFVLVGTEKAAQSEFVMKELVEFKKTGRTILLLDFGGAVGRARWYPLIPGLAAESELNPTALTTGDPSPNVLSYVEKSFNYTRRNQRMFRMFIGALIVFLVLAAVSAVAFYIAQQQVARASAATILANQKTKEAETAVALAEEKTKELLSAEERVKLKTGEAERATKLATDKTEEANAATTLAREKTHAATLAQAEAVKAEGRRRAADLRAREQESVANSREGAATALSLLETDPEEGVKHASKAYDSAPTTQAADALRRSLFDSHIQSVLRGHEGIVTDATFDSSARLALTVSQDRTLRIWEVGTGKEVAKLSGEEARENFKRSNHRNSVTANAAFLDVALSPDGAYAAAAGRGGVMFLWKLKDAATEDKPRLLRGSLGRDGREVTCSDFCAIRSVAFSPDGRHVVAAGDDGVVWVWETGTGKQVAALHDHFSPINMVTFSPDGRRIVSTGDNAEGDELAMLWEWKASRGADNPRQLRHQGPVESAVFSADGKHLVTATNRTVQGDTFVRSEGGEAWVWETDTGKSVARLAGHAGPLVWAEFSPDGEFVVTASADETARVWRWNSEELSKAPAILRGHTAELTGAEFSPDGQFVVTASADGTARIWKHGTNREAAEELKVSAEPPTLAVLRGHGAAVRKAAYSRDGRHIVTASDDRSARVWRAQVENVVGSLPEHRLVVEGGALSPDTRHVVTTTVGYHPVRVWDRLGDGRRAPVAELRLPVEAHFSSATFSPDGRFVAASADRNRDRDAPALGVAVWEWGVEGARRNPILLEGHPGLVHSVAFSNDPAGRYIVTAGGSPISTRDGMYRNPEAQAIRIWEWSSETGRRNPVVLSGHDARVSRAVFSPDDRYVVSASYDGTVMVWDWRTEEGRRNPVVLKSIMSDNFPSVPQTAIIPASFTDVAISPGGRYVVAAGGGINVANVWEWQDAEKRLNPVLLRGHTARVSSVAFGPSDSLILTSGQDGTERLWNARTGLPISILSGHAANGNRASFSRDGKLVLATDDRRALIYSCDKCAVEGELPALATTYVSTLGYSPATPERPRPPGR